MTEIGDIEDLRRTIFGTKHLQNSNLLDMNNPAYFAYVHDLAIDILVLEKTIDFTNPKNIDTLMRSKSKAHKLVKKPRLSVVNYYLRKLYEADEIDFDTIYNLSRYFVSKKMRSQSGILQVTIATSGEEFSCEFDCYYCPNQEGMPRSYVAEGPSMRRARECNFDPILQFQNRVTAYSVNGHPPDKFEIIVIGGTWDSYDIAYQKKFVTQVYYAANTLFQPVDDRREMLSLEEEKQINQNRALSKIIGFTIETRPDQISPEQIKRCLSYGVTRVQIGVQHTDNAILKKINRQSTIEDAIEAIHLLKDAGLKVQTHWMPNLPGATPEKDIAMFDRIIYSQALQSDDWKIYPTIVTKTSDRDKTDVYTVIEKWYNDGKYVPYSMEELKEVIIHAKIRVPRQVRISRVFRDIPMINIKGGANVPNMREELHEIMEANGDVCECIRCREVKDRHVAPEDIHLRVHEYKASFAREFLISFESKEKTTGERVLHSFLRLRLPNKENPEFITNGYIKELKGAALIREVHVYGQMIPTYDKLITNNEMYKSFKNQHTGLGRRMIECAENYASTEGYDKIAITSGVGVRNYYKKYGYRLEGDYMVKSIVKDIYWRDMLLFITILMLVYIFTKIALYYLVGEHDTS
jgi:ELP3 family radical SAM enzyme/protein acetyltransferase